MCRRCLSSYIKSLWLQNWKTETERSSVELGSKQKNFLPKRSRSNNHRLLKQLEWPFGQEIERWSRGNIIQATCKSHLLRLALDFHEYEVFHVRALPWKRSRLACLNNGRMNDRPLIEESMKHEQNSMMSTKGKHEIKYLEISFWLILGSAMYNWGCVPCATIKHLRAAFDCVD